jgi:hypothetical protein
MAERIPTGDHFIEADVIRWKEAVFKPRRKKRRARAVRLGDRVVVAEILRQDREWVYLLVRHCELVSVTTGRLDRPIPLLQKGMETKRKRNTIARGKAERLPWSDENVRSIIASKFLGMRGTPRGTGI